MTRRGNDLTPKSLREATHPVFHYTSARGLLGIIESRLLRASEASGLNDLAEIRQGWNRIRDWLGAQPASRGIDLLSDFAADPLVATHETFVLSGSIAGDDANQWRLYADGGRGYAIELDPSVEFAAVSKTPPPLPTAAVSRPFSGLLWGDSVTVSPWFHVLYTDLEAVGALKELVISVESAISNAASGATDQDDYNVRYDEVKDDAYEALATIAHLIKASGFSGEHEVRVVATFLFASQHIEYRPGPHGIVSYTSLTSTPTGHPTSRVLRPPATGEDARLAADLPIRSVRLGPLLHPEHVSTVAAFLGKHDLKHATVEASTVPLR